MFVHHRLGFTGEEDIREFVDSNNLDRVNWGRRAPHREVQGLRLLSRWPDMANIDSVTNLSTRRLLPKNGTSFKEIFQDKGTEHDGVNVAAGMVAIEVAESPIPVCIT